MSLDLKTVLTDEQLARANEWFYLEDGVDIDAQVAEDLDDFNRLERDTAVIAGWLIDELDSILEQAIKNKSVPVDSVCDEWNDYYREVTLFADDATREAWLEVRGYDEYDDVDGFIDICNTAMATFKSVAN